MPVKLKWIVVGLLVGLPVAGGIVAVKLGQFQAMDAAAAQMRMPPERVNVFTVHEERWQPRLAAVGSVVPVRGTELAVETDGVVRGIHFEAGAMVPAGAELLQLDSEVEQAQLREAEAAAELARTNFRRAQELAKSRNLSQGDLDTARTGLQRATAQVAYFQALLARKTLRAPFAGRMGIHYLNVGQYVSKGKPVVTLQALDPVHVDFSLPQRHLGKLATGLTIELATDAWPGERFTGQLTAINPDIDPDTRNVRMRATLANPDGRLRPGMFVSVELGLDRRDAVLPIPSTAVAHGPHGDSVFLVGPAEDSGAGEALMLREKPVRLGERRGDFVVATEGVQAGDRVVSTGVFKLRDGMRVVIDNSLAPEFRQAPTPENT